MLILPIALGFRRFNAGMPIAGSCSLAIAAACHPPKDDVDAAYLPVQWGVPVNRERNAEGYDEVGHCTFTSEQVEPPVLGRKYAGIGW